jgi:Protein of unknown function (DUF3618)
VSLERVEQAKRNALTARARLDSTLGALQHRLKPGNLAGEAWDGVKDKSADFADGALQAVRKRPAAVSAVVGALALFLAREPLKRGISRLISGDGDEEGNDQSDAELSVTEGVS